MPISSLALNLGEHIKVKKDVLNSVIVSLRVGANSEPNDAQEKVREINSDDESESALIIKAYACQGINHTKKVKLEEETDAEQLLSSLATADNRMYMSVVDFDDHLEDISLDWTNPQFDD